MTRIKTRCCRAAEPREASRAILGSSRYERSAKFVVAAFFVFVSTSSRLPAAAQQGAGKPKWDVRISETRGPLRAADLTSPTTGASSQVLAGPTNGSDYGYLIFSRMAGGARGPSLFTLPDEHLYLVVEGRMNIHFGTEKFVVNRYEESGFRRHPARSLEW